MKVEIQLTKKRIELTFIKVLLIISIELLSKNDDQKQQSGLKSFINVYKKAKVVVKNTKENIFELIEMVLNNFTITKADLEIIYQELAKYFHCNDKNTVLTKEISNNFIYLLKVYSYLFLTCSLCTERKLI